MAGIPFILVVVYVVCSIEELIDLCRAELGPGHDGRGLHIHNPCSSRQASFDLVRCLTVKGIRGPGFGPHMLDSSSIQSPFHGQKQSRLIADFIADRGVMVASPLIPQGSLWQENLICSDGFIQHPARAKDDKIFKPLDLSSSK